MGGVAEARLGSPSRQKFERVSRLARTLSRAQTANRDVSTVLADLADRLGPKLDDPMVLAADLLAVPPPPPQPLAHAPPPAAAPLL